MSIMKKIYSRMSTEQLSDTKTFLETRVQKNQFKFQIEWLQIVDEILSTRQVA